MPAIIHLTVYYHKTVHSMDKQQLVIRPYDERLERFRILQQTIWHSQDTPIVMFHAVPSLVLLILYYDEALFSS